MKDTIWENLRMKMILLTIITFSFIACSSTKPQSNSPQISEEGTSKSMKDHINEILIRSIPLFNSCYKNQSNSSTNEGMLIANFTIEETGLVSQAEAYLESGTLPVAMFECITHTLKGLKFPPQNEGSIQVKQPINFRQKRP